MVSPLFAIRNGKEEQVAGTAFVIGEGYALTAYHVIADFVEKYEGIRDVNSHLNISFEMLMYLRFDGGETILPIKVLRTWCSRSLDIAILALGVPTDWADDHRWTVPTVALVPPQVGTTVCAVGFANSTISREPNNPTPTMEVHPRLAPGLVEEIYHLKRDSARMPFPSFQTDARYDGGMSGGPIFNPDGHVCGVVCSSIPPETPGETHTSFGSSIWPIIGTLVDSLGPDVATGDFYPALRLFESGVFQSKGLESVSISMAENGQYTASIRYNGNSFDCPGAI